MLTIEDDTKIEDILKSVKSIAVIGASDKPSRPSHGVSKFLVDKGYTVYMVNPTLEEKRLHGRPVYNRLEDIPHDIDMVDIFRNPDAAGQAIDDAITQKDEKNIKYIWMQLGVVNEEAARRAMDAGLEVVMDRCPSIEIRRLNYR